MAKNTKPPKMIPKELPNGNWTISNWKEYMDYMNKQMGEEFDRLFNSLYTIARQSQER